MTSKLTTLQGQIITDIETTSIVSATFGTTGKTTEMPFAECFFDGIVDVPADSNSFTDAELEMYVTVTGSEEDDVLTALAELMALWKPDALRNVLRTLDCINIQPTRRYLPIPDPNSSVKKYYGMAQFHLTVRYTY